VQATGSAACTALRVGRALQGRARAAARADPVGRAARAAPRAGRRVHAQHEHVCVRGRPGALAGSVVRVPQRGRGEPVPPKPQARRHGRRLPAARGRHWRRGARRRRRAVAPRCRRWRCARRSLRTRPPGAAGRRGVPECCVWCEAGRAGWYLIRLCLQWTRARWMRRRTARTRPRRGLLIARL